MAYERVNGAWPSDVPELTAQEAISAAKRLYRFATKTAWPGKVRHVKRLDGKRSVVMYGREMEVSPRYGWRGLVHSMSHRCHYRLHPGLPSHCTQHAFLEKEMIEHVVTSGWLDGKLKRPEKPKAVVDVQAVRARRVAERMKRWEAKRKRAEQALRKLRRQSAYYERQKSVNLSLTPP